MVRLGTILFAYTAAALAGMAVLVAAGWIDLQSLRFDRLGFIAPLFIEGALMGAALSLPIAVPTILYTELRRKSSVWIFATAGLLSALAVILSFSNYSLDPALWRPLALLDVVRIAAVTLAASLTYWLVAWHLFPPALPEAPTNPADEFS